MSEQDTGAPRARKISTAKALRELTESATEHARLRAQLERCEATRDRRIVRAVVLGVDKAAAGRAANVSRQRVGQIVDAAAAK